MDLRLRSVRLSGSGWFALNDDNARFRAEAAYREQLMRERRWSSPCKRAAVVRCPSTQADSHTSAHGQPDVWPRRLARGLMDAGPYPE
ncbi:hypothetical protein WME90_32315 [Sorangium sp. So ce375]|uniref:hypothetical protein n=1 Tax=Sorangium sp. So ce375 TaxID=3133306 RepID=UPI003F5C7D1C